MNPKTASRSKHPTTSARSRNPTTLSRSTHPTTSTRSTNPTFSVHRITDKCVVFIFITSSCVSKPISRRSLNYFIKVFCLNSSNLSNELLIKDVLIVGLKYPDSLSGEAFSKAMFAQHLELTYIFRYLFLAGLYAASIPHTDPAKFSLSSLFDSTISMIHPVVAAGSNRCEAFKSFFGITYEQMQEKNKTNFHDVLNIDLITKNGNIKYNLTATKRMNRLMAHAQTIVILVHGFMESSDGWMVNAIAPELLKKPELKVFALDGRKIINLEYFRSSTNVRFMGELLGTFLGEVIKNGQDPSKIYIVGHSLGSHIAGVAGKKVQELTGNLIGRITALDPAGPCFSNVSRSGRLDKTDAQYVDVIHSNAGLLGLKEPVGHKDFYPNGGITQPGCYISICDHSRAWELFAESVASPKHFPARKCENWTMFGEGLCSKNEISYMGLRSDNNSPGLYFLSTTNSPPYGMGSAGSG